MDNDPKITNTMTAVQPSAPAPVVECVDQLLNDGTDEIATSSPTLLSAHPNSRFQVYQRRWYILLVYSFAGFSQGYLWNMWGPIYQSMSEIYGWSHRQLALLPFYGTAIFTIFVVPSAWFLERYGLHKTMLLMTLLISASAVVRCFPVESEAATVIINISGIINGFPGVVTFYLPVYISAHWFPPNERKFATAVGTLLNVLGLAAAFLVGPAFIAEPGSGISAAQIENEYFRYTFVETGTTLLWFVLVAVYYPDKPPVPPSQSAAADRVSYWQGCRRLLHSKDFWILCAPMTLVFGTYSGWVTILSIDLQPRGVDQDHAGWIGFSTSLSGAFFGILAGKLGDLAGRVKPILIACCALALHGSFWLLLITRGVLVFSVTQAYIASIILGTACSAMLPINFELAAEICYPVDEAIVVAFLGITSNLWSCLFLIVFFFPSVGTAWIDWSLVTTCFLAFPLAFTIREVQKRSAIDTSTSEVLSNSMSVN